MKTYRIKNLILILIFLLTFSMSSCSSLADKSKKPAGYKLEKLANSNSKISYNDSKAYKQTDLIPISQNGLWGYVLLEDMETPVIPCQFDEMQLFNDYGYAFVSKNSQEGIIDVNGNFIEECQSLKTIKELDNGYYCVVESNGEKIVKNYFGDIYKLPKSTDVSFGAKDNFLICNNKKSFINLETMEVMDLPDFIDGKTEIDYIRAMNNPNFEIRLTDDKILIRYNNGLEEKYQYVEVVENGVIVGNYIEKDNCKLRKVGLLNLDGREIIAKEYYDIIHIYGDYYGVAELLDYNLDYKIFEPELYPKAIFKNGVQLTDFKYYYLDHVKDSVFYVYDRENYYFYDVESKKRYQTDNLPKAPLKSKIMGEYILMYYSENELGASYIIKDKKLIKKNLPTVFNDKFKIYYEYTASKHYPIFYPRIEKIENMALLNPIQADIEKIHKQDMDKFDKYYVNPNDRVISSIGYVKPNTISEYRDVLYITKFVHYLDLKDSFEELGLYSCNYSLLTGKRLNLNDLFIRGKESEERIISLIYDYINEEGYKLYKHTNYTDLLRQKNYNYIIKEEGIEIYYNPGEIAPVSEGIIRVKLPMNKIKRDIRI